MLEILKLTEFEAKDLTWKSFPNHVGHKDFPGLLPLPRRQAHEREGRGDPAAVHAVPRPPAGHASTAALKTVASTVAPGLTPPDGHNAPNWMHDHRSKIDSSCTMCHGPIKWGKDGGSFCSNPACHGRKWPEMNLDATKG